MTVLNCWSADYNGRTQAIRPRALSQAWSASALLLLRKRRRFLLSEENTHLSVLLAYVFNKYNIGRPMTWAYSSPAENAAKYKRLSGDYPAQKVFCFPVWATDQNPSWRLLNVTMQLLYKLMKLRVQPASEGRPALSLIYSEFQTSPGCTSVSQSQRSVPTAL